MQKKMAETRIPNGPPHEFYFGPKIKCMRYHHYFHQKKTKKKLRPFGSFELLIKFTCPPYHARASQSINQSLSLTDVIKSGKFPQDQTHETYPRVNLPSVGNRWDVHMKVCTQPQLLYYWPLSLSNSI